MRLGCFHATQSPGIGHLVRFRRIPLFPAAIRRARRGAASPIASGLPPAHRLAPGDPDPGSGHCRGYYALRMNPALVHSISTEISTEIAPHSRLVFEHVTQVSKEATVASVTGVRVRPPTPSHRLRQARRHQRDLTPRRQRLPVRGATTAFLVPSARRWPEVPSGHRQPARRRRRRVTR